MHLLNAAAPVPRNSAGRHNVRLRHVRGAKPRSHRSPPGPDMVMLAQIKATHGRHGGADREEKRLGFRRRQLCCQAVGERGWPRTQKFAIRSGGVQGSWCRSISRR